MHQREQTTSPPSPPPGYPSPPHPAAVQLLQAPVDPLLHVQPPLQLSPVILDGDARVPLLQPPGAAPRPPGPRWSLQLAQHPLAQPLSCHRGPGPGPGAALCAFAGRPGDLLRAGAGPAGGGGSDSQGGRPRPDRPGPQFPRLQREDLPLRPREARGCSWFRYGRGPGAPGPAEWLGLPGPGSPGRGGAVIGMASRAPSLSSPPGGCQGQCGSPCATYSVGKGRSSHSTHGRSFDPFHLFIHPCIHLFIFTLFNKYSFDIMSSELLATQTHTHTHTPHRRLSFSRSYQSPYASQIASKGFLVSPVITRFPLLNFPGHRGQSGEQNRQA